MNRAEVLQRMEAGRAEWERALVQIGEPHMSAPLLPNGWSAKDIVAHVMAYERWTAAQIRAAARGNAPTPRELYDSDETPAGADTRDTDARNIALQEHYQDAPLAEVMAGSQRAFDELVAVIQETPEDLLADRHLTDWLDGASWLDIAPQQSYEHYQQHLPDLRALVQRIEGAAVPTLPGSGAVDADRR